MKKHKILNKQRLMKNTTSIISILVVALLVFSSAVSATTTSNNTTTLNEKITRPIYQGIADVSPNIDPIISSVGSTPSQQGSNPQTLDMWELYFSFDVDTASGAPGNTGAHCIDPYLYTSRWASNIQHQYDMDGVMLKQYSVGGVSGVRDLAYDGDYLYAGPSTGTIWGWDPISETLESTITGGFQCRAIAYDDDKDTFYVSNWGDPVWEVNRDGDILDSFNLALTTSTYGFAYDQWSSSEGYDGPFMWVFDQGTPSLSGINQWDLASGAFTGVEKNVHDDFPGTSAGGLFLTEEFEAGEALLGGLAQSMGDPFFIYDIDTLTILPDHDVALKQIISPEAQQSAVENVPMKVLIQNKGNNSETFDAQMNIIKCEGSGEDLLNENFSGATFPPDGWTTDWWQQSASSNAGGLSPEARCYYYWQYYSNGVYHYDYYDNFIMSPTVNASGLEKVNLYFAFAADIQSNSYMYLKFRKNSTSAWKDVTPWDVPITSDFQDWFEIGCYGFQTGGDIGSEFQFKFEYLGYYSYFRNWYLDDVRIEPCGGCAEYAEIVEDITIDVGEELEVDFPDWTPTEWQNESTENTWQEYPINAFTLLEGDEVEKNNEKWKLVDIYFPWMHDVAAIDVDGPESGPAQTFNVVSKIKNVGQNDECCFKTHVAISEIDYNNPIPVWTEDMETGNYYTLPTGWTHGGGNPNAWYCSNFLYYLPDPYGTGMRQMRCYWYYAQDAELISPVIDSSGVGSLELTMGMYYDHFTGDYELYVDIRPNPDEFWGEIQPWDNPVTANMGPDWYVADATIGVGSETQLRFRNGGYYFNMNYWYFDNLELIGYDVKEPEFAAEVCVESIIPGEELEMDFGDWTPDFLADETTGTITYIVRTFTNLEDPPDKNPANDLYQYPAVLEFFHDVGVKEITSPSASEKSDKRFQAVDAGMGQFVWFDPDTPGVFNTIGPFPSPQFPQGATFHEKVMYVCDTVGTIWTVDHITGVSTLVGSSGTGELVGLESDGTTLWGISTKNLYTIDPLTGAGTLVGPMGNPSLMISIGAAKGGPLYAVELDFASGKLYELDTATGAGTLIGTTGVGTNYGQDMSYEKEEDILWDCAFNYNTFSGELWQYNTITGAGTFIGTLQGGAQTTCFAIPGGGGISPDVYVSLGSQNIDAIVENVGTFPELDLTCYADIYEYITNCTEGTLVYEDNISDIDLDVPLGGTETLNFDSYNFATEGLYGIFFSIPDEGDDYPGNNEELLGIGADDTPPVSNHVLVPAAPNGDNGWYVSDVEVTLSAGDPEIGCEIAGSGVKEINYKIGGGSWQTLPGEEGGTFIIDVDDENLAIEYYSVDDVGNEESPHNSFQINMDQTVADIEEVTWEAFQDPPIYGLWYVTFTCDAVDETSGMDRVEMFINDGHHETITGAGPIYEFTIEWSEAFKSCTFYWYHYDVAGNVIVEDMPGSDPESYANYQQQQSNPISKKLAHQ